VTPKAEDDEFFTELKDYIQEKFTNVKYFELMPDQIEKSAGKSLKIRVVVTNFLGLSRPNDTNIEFLNTKQLLLVDLQDIYTF
jgi:hypothetical protein